MAFTLAAFLILILPLAGSIACRTNPRLLIYVRMSIIIVVVVFYCVTEVF